MGEGQGQREGVAGPGVSHRSWPYGSDGCQAHGFQGFVTALASICSTAAVAWGRYHHYCTRKYWCSQREGRLCGEGDQDKGRLCVSQSRGD